MDVAAPHSCNNNINTKKAHVSSLYIADFAHTKPPVRIASLRAFCPRCLRCAPSADVASNLVCAGLAARLVFCCALRLVSIPPSVRLFIGVWHQRCNTTREWHGTCSCSLMFRTGSVFSSNRKIQVRLQPLCHFGWWKSPSNRDAICKTLVWAKDDERAQLKSESRKMHGQRQDTNWLSTR
jgi:hypothetical protein